MRVSSFCLVIVAVSLIFVSGCKSRSQSGVKTFRLFGARIAKRTRSVDAIAASDATRGTAECDCYVCRSNRDAEPYVVEPVGQPMESEVQPRNADGIYAAPQFDAPSPEVRPDQFEPSTVGPADLNGPVQTSQRMDRQPERQQNVPNEVIEDERPENRLPTADSLDDVSIDVIPKLPATVEATSPVPATGGLEIEANTDVETNTPAIDDENVLPAFPSSQINRNRVPVPFVQSEEIPTATASVQVNQSDDAFTASAFRVTDKSSTTRQSATAANSGRSIWFAPSAPAKTAAAPEQTGLADLTQTNQTTSAARQRQSFAPRETIRPTGVGQAEPFKPNFQTPRLSPAAAPMVPGYGETFRDALPAEKLAPAPLPVSTPARETEMQDQSFNAPIVLRARPVHRHTVYNGRPVQAPVREARRLDDPAGSPTFKLAPEKSYFQQLPPASQRITKPAPASSVQTASVLRRLPIAAAAERNLGQRSVAQAMPSPHARVVQPKVGVLTLQAVASKSGASLPPIASIHRMNQTVVGSLQVHGHPGQTAHDANQQAPARLMTSPWRPMTLGDQEDQQVRRSIRSLTIHPENISNAGRSTIDR